MNHLASFTRSSSSFLLVRARLVSRVVSATIPNTASSVQPGNRALHATNPNHFPIRRRRRPKDNTVTSTTDEETNTEQESFSSPLKHIPVDDDEGFILGATALLDKLEVAVEGMKKLNETFEVERFFSDMGEVLTIDLGPKEGKYRIEMSLDDHIFEYTSPISGKILYNLSATTGEWVGVEDGHLFEGIFVRDLIRQCHGLPKL